MKLNANINYNATYTPDIKKLYEVDITETYKRTVEILATSEDNAYELVDELVNDGKIDLPCDGGDYDYSRDLFVGKSKDISKWERVKKQVTLKSYDNVEDFIMAYAIEKINFIAGSLMNLENKRKTINRIDIALKARSKGLITIDECILMICDCLSD